MKKICCALICVWMVAALAGCGKKEVPSTLQEENAISQQQQSSLSLTTPVEETSSAAVTQAPANSAYFCWIMEKGADDPIITRLPNIDVEKFDALVKFSERNEYDPYGSDKDAATRRLPYAASAEPEIRFGKEESPGVALKGAAGLHVWEGKLVLEWYTSGDEYMLVVDVPDDLSQYFIGVLDGLKLD